MLKNHISSGTTILPEKARFCLNDTRQTLTHSQTERDYYILRWYAAQSAQAYQGGDFRFALLQLYQAIMSAIKVLVSKRMAIDADRLPDFQVLKLAAASELLNRHETEVLNELRIVRNQIPHNVHAVVLTEEQGQRLQNVALDLLRSIEDRRKE